MDNHRFVDIDQAVKLEPMCDNESVDDSSLFMVYGGHVVKDEISEPESPETDDINGPANMETMMEYSHDVAGTECGMYQASTLSAAGHMESRTNYDEVEDVVRGGGCGGTRVRRSRRVGKGTVSRVRVRTRGGGRGNASVETGDRTDNDVVVIKDVVRGGVGRIRSGGGSTRVVGGRRAGRGGRVRTRGGGRARGHAQPATSDSYLNDVPMETQLVPKKRRRVLSPPSGHAEVPSPPTAGPSTSPPLPTSSYSYGEMVPSPAACEDNVESFTSRLARHSTLLNYGSEEDSDLDDALGCESELFPMLPSRTEWDVFEEEESAAQASEPDQLPASPSPSLSLEPRGLFDFEWRDFPNPPVPPTERREVFSQTNCGPTATAPYRTPYDAFIAIWTREFMEYIVVETNRYAQQLVDKQYQDGSLRPNSRITNWCDTNVRELYCFFGLLIGFGLCVKGDVKEYWCKEGALATPNLANYMSITRYSLLSRCLHFNDNTTDLRTMTRPQAKLFKIAPVVKHLNHQFQSLYNLNRNVALDESLTMWKGRLDIKQFIRTKAASAGIKTFEVCEAQTGYLWRLKVHAGREEVAECEVTPVSGVIPTLVLELLKGLEYKGHTIWMDNYYNSPALARVLKSLGFDCVGTLRTERQCVPPQLAQLKESDMVVGQISGCTSGDVDVMVWRDKGRVGIISTYHGAGVHADKNGITKPIAIRDYNLCMGGVDKKDQMLSAYPLERKRGQVWYKKLFKRLLNASVLNAYILYKRSSSDTQGRISRHRDFRTTLFNQILHNNCTGVVRRSLPVPVFDTRDLTAGDMLQHFLAEYGYLQKDGRLNEKIRRTCGRCKIRCTTYCRKCNVALCIGCSMEYHKTRYNL